MDSVHMLDPCAVYAPTQSGYKADPSHETSVVAWRYTGWAVSVSRGAETQRGTGNVSDVERPGGRS